ncbi:MAG: HPr(Ser) kinase/phosphatase [Acidobacteriota bacterium]
MTQRDAPRPTIPVGDLLTGLPSDFAMRVLAGGSGLDRSISSSLVQQAGLALAERADLLRPGTVQVLGRREVAYLSHLGERERRALLAQIGRIPIACLVVTHDATPHPDLVHTAQARELPLLGTAAPTARVVDALSRLLEERLAPEITLHGTFIDIYGVGVLILGESGMGKSESALELILRGHRMVSDDTVTVRRIGSVLNGTGSEVSRYHMELRGIGIINIKDLYGVAAVRERKDIELVIRLVPWSEDQVYDRLGLDEKTYTILGLERPFIEMPVGPGRNLSVMLEVAARHHLLKRKGYHPARELADRIHEAMARKR